MIINQTPPNIRQLPSNRPDVFVFEITGYLESSDVENLYGLLEGAHEISDPINTMFIFHDYQGVHWNEAVHGEIFLDKANALKHIKKCALVGAPGWVHAGLVLLRPFVNAKVQLYSSNEEQAAREWMNADDSSSVSKPDKN